MTIDQDTISTSKTSSKKKLNGSTITFRSSSPSTSHFPDDMSRGRKPGLQNYNAPLSNVNVRNGDVEDVMSSTEGSARGTTGVQASPGVGAYAYSTTLRRQPSLNLDGPSSILPSHHHSHQNASPSPFRRRSNSGGGAEGIWERVLNTAKRVTGGDGYEAVDRAEQEEERRRSIERRQRETPSAIYAHKTVDVSSLYFGHQAVQLMDTGHNTRFRISPYGRPGIGLSGSLVSSLWT